MLIIFLIYKKMSKYAVKEHKVNVSFTLEPSLIKKLQEEKQKYNVSNATIVATALNEFFNKNNDEK